MKMHGTNVKKKSINRCQELKLHSSQQRQISATRLSHSDGDQQETKRRLAGVARVAT